MWAYFLLKTRTQNLHATERSCSPCDSGDVFEGREPRFDVGQGASELIPVTLIRALLQIPLNTSSRENQHFPATARFGLSGCQLRVMFP